MRNKFGYDELILYSAPFNLLTILLYPFLLSKNLMLKVSKKFSILMFWLENIFFIALMLIYELVLLPIVFIKICFNILSFGDAKATLYYLPLWTFTSPFVLLAAVGHDLYQFIRILLNYQEDEEDGK